VFAVPVSASVFLSFCCYVKLVECEEENEGRSSFKCKWRTLLQVLSSQVFIATNYPTRLFVLKRDSQRMTIFLSALPLLDPELKVRRRSQLARSEFLV